jgi:hypothetical protein
MYVLFIGSGCSDPLTIVQKYGENVKNTIELRICMFLALLVS